MKHSFWEGIKKWLQLSDKAGNKQKYLLILLLMGIALMFISKMIDSPAQTNSLETINTETNTKAVFKEAKEVTNKNIKSYEDRYSNELKDLLEQMQGVGRVSVWVELSRTEQKAFATDDSTQRQTTSENDKNGGKRTIEDQKVDEKIVIVSNDGKEEPIVVTTEKPKIKGVAVLAEGAENIQTKAMIIDLVTKVFDIGSNEVFVGPKNSEGE
ncbi:stage III sporulation protein AG [Bacillus sp. NEB1478]|uniref:stage III sporulation protein AG n=1 Tax=Bacillus sp. NEB1478 TaxID=3073816 RepID=UPI0028735B56|nr:stage III sporulation protein AG [Bacillus sp. NEB1478]WNB93584.1 stage III sporulation protein AG [Bacillus sp. NEB1478]